jgi:hypothetical protein
MAFQLMSNPYIGNQRAPRVSCRIPATLRLDPSADPVTVFITNYSATGGGARVEVPEEISLPPRFKLHIPSTGQLKYAKLKWRKGIDCGVEYGPPPSPEMLAIEELQERILRIERNFAMQLEVLGAEEQLENRLASLDSKFGRLEAMIRAVQNNPLGSS